MGVEGVLVVFGSVGAVETGYYYVAYAIAGVVLMVGSSMLGLLLPVLSGLSDGRKRAASQVLRISAALVCPLAVFLMFYPGVPLSLLGGGYVRASSMLSVLLAPSLFMLVFQCVYSLVYAYGFYWLVLGLGLAANVPRIVLYYLLVPLFGGFGASIAFAVGAFTGFIAAVFIARRVGFMVDFRGLGLAFGIPLAPTLLSYLLGLPWFVAGFLVLGSCLVGYPLLGVIGRRDLREISLAFLGREKTSQLYYRFKPLIDNLFRE